MPIFGRVTLPFSLRSEVHDGGFSWLAMLVLYVLQQPVSAQTNSTDAVALNVLKRSLFPASGVALTSYNWTDEADICGTASCGPLACNAQATDILTGTAGEVPSCHWGGICCTNWEVTGLSLSSTVPAASASQRSWLEVVGWLQNLQVLQLPQQGYSCLPVLTAAILLW